MFYDRIDAGERLADALAEYNGNPNAVVVAIPRGGVVIGYCISKKLHLALDIILIKKIGHPGNKEFAIGAAGLKYHIREDHPDVPQMYIETQLTLIRELLNKQLKMYYGKRSPRNLRNKVVLLVDDGIATGNTMMTAISLIRKESPAKIVIAVPVGAADTIRQLTPFAERTLCLESHELLQAISYYYKNFDQVSDHEVQLLLYQAAMSEGK